MPRSRVEVQYKHMGAMRNVNDIQGAAAQGQLDQLFSLDEDDEDACGSTAGSTIGHAAILAPR